MSKRGYIIALLVFIVIITACIVNGLLRSMVSVPDAFCFYKSNGDCILEHLCEDTYDENGEYRYESGLDRNTNTYHLFTFSDYLDENDCYAYVTGTYWYYPFKPIVIINNDQLVKVTTLGGSHNSRTYHFRYTFYKDELYTITVICGKAIQSMKLIVHAY